MRIYEYNNFTMDETPLFLEIKEKLIAQNRPKEDIDEIEHAFLYAA